MLEPLLEKGVTLYLFHKREIPPKRPPQQLRKYNSPDQLSLSPYDFELLVDWLFLLPFRTSFQMKIVNRQIITSFQPSMPDSSSSIT